MLDRGFYPDFSPAVQQEISALPHAHAQAKGDPSVRDMRRLLWASIDNDDSRDLDQLSVATAGPGGVVRLLVAIADVDALVPRGSAIDHHAEHNTTSVYTAAEVFSMLPEQLSTDLTSLNQDEDRLAIVVEMMINSEGKLVGSDVYRALVNNHAKLAYDSVAAWLDGLGPAPERVTSVHGMDEQLRLQDRAGQCLKNRRHLHGALDLETIEPRAVFIGDMLADLRIETRNRAKEMIEDFMIAANGVTARFIEGKGCSSLRRVLRSPARWDKIVDLAGTYGHRLPAEPNAGALEEFLVERRRANPEGFVDLSLAVVKMMGSGEYTLDRPGSPPPGHFGLAVRDYTHSTAPNRRFPDLITQRQIKAAIAGQPPPYSDEELSNLASHCTQREDDANRVERQVRKSAAALLLADKRGQTFDGIVTGVSSSGTWVRIFHPPVDGKVVRGFEGLDVGDRIQVQLLSSNVERGFIDFGYSGRAQQQQQQR